MIYNKIVLNCFFEPRHVGVLDVTKERVVFLKNSQQNQGEIEFYLEYGNDGIIQQLRFKTNGNPYLIAALEWSCRQLEGVSLNQTPPIDYQLLVRELDIPVPQSPLALRVVKIIQDVLILLKSRLG